jgi:lipoate-protein ligase A
LEIPAHDPKHDHAEISNDEVNFLDPGFLNPAENMALDALLLDLPGWWFRLTRWSTPCVTLGRFQTFLAGSTRSPIQRESHGEIPQIYPFQISPQITLSHPATALPAVRRITGGGSILHGEDLTIAISGPCPSAVFPRRKPAEVAAYFSQKISAVLGDHIQTRGGHDEENSMQSIVDCFDRRSPSDLVFDPGSGPVKAGGLALAFRPGRVLLEGSLKREHLSLDRPHDQTHDRQWLSRVAQQLLSLPPHSSLKEGSHRWHEDLSDIPWEESHLGECVRQKVDSQFGQEKWNRR